MASGVRSMLQDFAPHFQYLPLDMKVQMVSRHFGAMLIRRKDKSAQWHIGAQIITAIYWWVIFAHPVNHYQRWITDSIINLLYSEVKTIFPFKISWIVTVVYVY
jgi:hypothetical protein